MKMLAWMIKHDSHGLMLHSLVFLPEGEEPGFERWRWIRAPWLDGDTGEQQ